MGNWRSENKKEEKQMKKWILLLGIILFLANNAAAAPPVINTCSLPNVNHYTGEYFDINFSASGQIDVNRFIFWNDDEDLNKFTVQEYVEDMDLGQPGDGGWTLSNATEASDTTADCTNNGTCSISKDTNDFSAGPLKFGANIGYGNTDNTSSIVLNGTPYTYFMTGERSGPPYTYTLKRSGGGTVTLVTIDSEPICNNPFTAERDITGLWTFKCDTVTLGTYAEGTGFASNFTSMEVSIDGSEGSGRSISSAFIQTTFATRNKKQQITSNEFLDHFQYYCYAKNGDGETFSGPHTYNAVVDVNIAINVWDSNTGNIAPDYTLTLVDGSLQSFENQRYFNLSQFLTRTNTDPDQRQLTHTITAFDNNTLSIFPPQSEQFLLSEDTNSYDMNLTTASWSFSMHNQTTSGGCTVGNNHCWRLWYAEDEEDLFQSILTGQWLDGSGNIPNQVQANIPSGLTTLDFGAPITAINIEHSQTLQWFNDMPDANNLDFNMMVITPTTLAQTQVRDKQGQLMKDVLIEVYQDLTTSGELYLYNREYTGYRDGDGIVLFPIDANQTIKIVASKEGYQTVTRTVHAGLFNDTGNIVEITLLTEEEFGTAYRITATPINPNVLTSGTEARVFTQIASPMKVCYEAYHNTDTNLVESANNPAASGLLETAFVQTIQHQDINYMIRVMIDTDQDQNCQNNIINTFQWQLVDGLGQDSFEDVENLDPIEQEIFEWYGTGALIIIGIIGGAIIGRGTAFFFVSITLFAIWQITTFQSTSLLLPMFLGLIWLGRDLLHNAMGGNR